MTDRKMHVRIRIDAEVHQLMRRLAVEAQTDNAGVISLAINHLAREARVKPSTSIIKELLALKA